MGELPETGAIARINVNLTFVVTSTPDDSCRSIVFYDKEDHAVHISNVISGLDSWLAQMEAYLTAKNELKKGREVPPIKVNFQTNKKATHFVLSMRSENQEALSDFALYALTSMWLEDLKKLIPSSEVIR